MKTEIQANLQNPVQLEKLYRTNKVAFKREFNALYPEHQGNPLADGWNARLNFEAEEINWGSGKEIWLVIAASMLAGFIAKIPTIFSVQEDFFYPRNLSFIFLPILTAYFAWKHKVETKHLIISGSIMLLCLIYINLLPGTNSSDTLVLACIHLPLLLWVILGAAFAGKDLKKYQNRLDFLKYNGDLVVMTALILLAGGIMTGITIGLFSLIGLNIEQFYFENVVMVGLAAAPIVATYLTQTNPQLVGKVSPVIARIFSPLVLVMLVIYLVAIVFSGKDPFNDREFLLLFNALLVGVLAIIFFSVAETSHTEKSQPERWVLFLLAMVTIVVNGIALSAIVFRISEWGITPNRLAVLGGNLLILTNLLVVTWQLFQVVSRRTSISEVGKAIAIFLPVYFLWTLIVTFLFPVLFGFK